MKLYQQPNQPGFVGAIQWRTLRGPLALLGLGFPLATQYLAHQFSYHVGLGAPWLRVGNALIYPPWSWVEWTWRWSATPAWGTLLQGVAIVLGVGLLAMAWFAYAAVERTRSAHEKTGDLHGSARWANPTEIIATGLVSANEGVYVGGWLDRQGRALRYLRHDGPEHVLAFAPTRSGKGVGLVIPTLLAWPGACVVYDIKGENWARTAGFRQASGQRCLKFSPTETASSRFNPLAEIRLFSARDVSDAQNIAEMIVKTGEVENERYWQDAAASIMTGMILHAAYEAAAANRLASLADLAHTFTRAGQSFRDSLNAFIVHPHDPTYRAGWLHPASHLPTHTHPVVAEKCQEMLDKEDRDFSGVLSTAKTALTLYADPLVAANTSESDFLICDLVDAEQPISLYLVVPPSDKLRLRPLIRLLFTMIVNRLTEKMEFDASANRPARHRLLFLIDEFPSLKRMEIFSDALSYMAGYGLKAYLITQDVRQIQDAYGNHEAIVSNCHVRIAFAPNQLETAELLSKMTGVMTIEKASYTYSGSRLATVAGSISATIDQVERPLLTPDEVLRLPGPKKSGHGANERITSPGDMLIFMAGHRPIYGKQMLYFLDPELARRAAFNAPELVERKITRAAVPLTPLPQFATSDPA